jgi:hypothetical protein
MNVSGKQLEEGIVSPKILISIWKFHFYECGKEPGQEVMSIEVLIVTSEYRLLIVTCECRLLIVTSKCRLLIVTSECRLLIVTSECRLLIVTSECRLLIVTNWWWASKHVM